MARRNPGLVRLFIRLVILGGASDVRIIVRRVGIGIVGLPVFVGHVLGYLRADLRGHIRSEGSAVGERLRRDEAAPSRSPVRVNHAHAHVVHRRRAWRTQIFVEAVLASRVLDRLERPRFSADISKEVCRITAYGYRL